MEPLQIHVVHLDSDSGRPVAGSGNQDSESDGQGRAAEADRILNKLASHEFHCVVSDDAITDDRSGKQGDAPDALLLVQSSAALLSDAVQSLRRKFSRTPMLLVSPQQPSDQLLRYLQLGVQDFVFCPFNVEEIRARLLRVVGRRTDDRQDTIERLKHKMGLRHLVGQSEQFQEAIKSLRLIAGCDSTILIRGETGTGKELFARAAHYLSPRSAGPFVAINCGALPLELVENELFGHARAAYTSATTSQHGLIHDADHGTLFLDEVDSLSLKAQTKLLRFLQEKEYRALGSTRTMTADVRVIAATNSNVDEAVKNGQLRLDFFYRLDVLPLHLPGLRDRASDVVLLAEHFLKKYAPDENRCPEFTPDAKSALINYDWPGNVRQLEHVVERAIVLADGHPLIDAVDLRLPLEESEVSFQEAKARAVAKFERGYIENLLAIHGGNITHAARSAKKNRRALWELIRKHGIEAASFK